MPGNTVQTRKLGT